ncbi:roadblock domain containing 3 [Capsaspora owczarzaki ATCC 30864]|uniref:Roadblock domain containing 3 n=1 Tax=Capsaspora owczarzaki (strain ATCC 30864) TaxID=595528 RepID=A0A0D2WN43_CAPO3|nr:roadblock domain containing 3 [Capsaspora owczarzaki ATCC 30864]
MQRCLMRDDGLSVGWSGGWAGRAGLLTQNGTLIALTGDNDQSARVTGAIAANVWHAFEREGKAAFDTTAMNFLLLGCESGRVGVTRVAGLLLCLYAKPSVEYGLLKSKALALAKHLEEPLSSVVIGGLAVGTNLDNF